MANFLSVGIPSAILGALGSGQEQRERADRLAQIEAQRRYQAERLGLDRETLAETRRQSDLKYGPVTVNVPGVGEITAQREFIPSLIAAASAREKDISPEEVTALTGYRDRALLPAGGTINRGGIPWDPTLEAEASRQAMNQTRVLPKSTEGISPMTVDLPQTSVPRSSFEKVMTEAALQRKETEQEARKQKQGKANARYRQLYSTAIAQQIPHALADATAIAQATQEFGIAPEREAFVGTPPVERPLVVPPGGSVLPPGQTKPAFVAPPPPKEPPRFDLPKFRADLATRVRGLTTGNPQVDAMTPDQAQKVLEDLGRSDFLLNLFRGNIGGGSPGSPSTPSGPEAEADALLKGLE